VVEMEKKGEEWRRRLMRRRERSIFLMKVVRREIGVR
jgi:hypothetical protein